MGTMAESTVFVHHQSNVLRNCRQRSGRSSGRREPALVEMGLLLLNIQLFLDLFKRDALGCRQHSPDKYEV